MSIDISHITIDGIMETETSLREWFSEEYNRKSSSPSIYLLDSPNNVSQYSSLLFPLIPKPSITTTDTVNVTLQYQPLTPINMIHQHQHDEPLFRNRERELEAMTQAILAVLTAPSSPPSTSSSPQLKGRATAFKRYYGVITRPPPPSLRKQNMMKRAISFYNRLNTYRRERLARENGGPTATQLHHIISERKRREKLNESFQALRTLLPLETKKDKASILDVARDQLISLKGDISKLLERNRELGEKLAGEREMENVLQTNERFSVRVRHIPESSSRESILDLRVVLRGDSIRVGDLLLKLLEFLKQINNVNLVSIEARTPAREYGESSVVLVSLMLKIEGECDESTFQEAVRRVMADLEHVLT